MVILDLKRLLGCASYGNCLALGLRICESRLFTRSLAITITVFLLAATDCRNALAADSTAAATNKTERGFSYRRDIIASVPWSVHVVQIDRSATNIELQTSLAYGQTIGLDLITLQMKRLSPELGRPLAAVNGDFYRNDDTPYKGDPKGLQIMNGELVSAPWDWSCFWMDAGGSPHIAAVTPIFEIIWPDNKRTPIGLNEERRKGTAVLYTSRTGRTTGTPDGRELILEATASTAWLPLRVGQEYTARVREVREEGNSPTSSTRLVLSISKELLGKIPAVNVGDMVRISLTTSPSLVGTRTAIGGGPALVQDGKARSWGLLQVRHPRSAVGWNDKYIYLVEVDGRQAGLSVGMTYSELADYMVKLGCKEALNLDGGGSATMWVLGQVVNSPSEGQERGMANALVVVQKPDPSH